MLSLTNLCGFGVNAQNATYLYFRLQWTAVIASNDGYTEFAEVEVRETAGGTNKCTGGTATSFNYYAAGYEAVYAFNGANDRGYIGVGATGWLKYQFTAPVKIGEVKISMIYTGAPYYRAIKNFTIEGSNDGTNFTVLKTITNESGWVDLTYKTYTV